MTDHEFNRLVPAADAINLGRRYNVHPFICFSISLNRKPNMKNKQTQMIFTFFHKLTFVS